MCELVFGVCGLSEFTWHTDISEVRKLKKISLSKSCFYWFMLFALGGMLNFECRAETPKNIIVMAKALDDLITLDPAEAFEFSGTEILANVYDRLFIANPENPSEPKLGLVEQWLRSSDGLEYRFLVRDDATFENGDLLTSEDVVFSIRRAVLLNKSPAFILNQLGLRRSNVEHKVKTLDDEWFTLEVDRPYSASFVLNVLSSVVASVVDKSTLLQHFKNGDWGGGWLRSNTAGSGSFRVSKWNVGEYVLLDRTDSGSSPIKRIVIRDVREPATQRLMLTRGDIDIARDLTPDHIASLSQKTDIITWSENQARIFYIALNQENSALANPLVRKAMRLAVDYRGIAAHLLPGRAVVHQAFLPVGFMGALRETPFALDLAGARRLIDEFGESEKLKFEVNVRSDPIALQIAQAVQRTLGQVGIELDIHPSDGKQVLTKYRARRHDIYMGYWGPDYLDPHSNAAAFASNPNNMENAEQMTLAWRNNWIMPQLTTATDQAVLIHDPGDRQEAYQRLQRRVQSDSPFIILFQEKALIATTGSVQGFVVGLTADQTMYANIIK